MRKSTCLLMVASLLFCLVGCRPERQLGIKERKVEKENFSLFYEEILKSDQLAALHNENLPLPGDLVLTDSKGKNIFLREAVTDSSIIVRYSVHACGDCITFVNTCVTKHVGNTDRVVLLLADVPVRDLHVMRTQLKLPNIFRVDSLPLPFEAVGEPYLFTLDKECRTAFFFIPRKEFPEQTPKYLQFIARKM